ncbi:MAG: choice-of-anchor Q domain-containing protein, partial [Salibacteraceae bacterium]
MKQLFIFLGLLMSVGLSAQTRYYVDATAGGGSGLSWAQALPSLKQALALTVAGDEVWVASGTDFTHADPATGALTNNPLSFFNVPSGVHLYGGFNGTETQLSDRNWWQNRSTLTTSTSNNPLNYGVRLFAMSGSSNVIIDGFTLEKTYQNQIGAYGNVLSNSNGGDVVVSNCVIRENYVKPGGRGLIQIINGDLEVSNCLVYNNEGGHGAIALTIGSGSSINFRNATIIYNVSTTYINHNLSGGVVTYTNSIVWNSGAVPGGGTTYNHCITDFSNGGGSNYNQNPNLTASPEYRPQPGSIAINNGNGSIGLPTLDLHHNNRVIDGQVDIGAIEYENITADFWYSQVAGNLPENPTCPLSDDPVYRPAETSVCRDNGIVAGGDLETLIQSYGLTCDKGFGNTDIKIVRTDVLGNEIFHRV